MTLLTVLQSLRTNNLKGLAATLTLHLSGHQARLLLPPVVKRRLADSRLAADLGDCRAIFRLLQHECDLCL